LSVRAAQPLRKPSDATPLEGAVLDIVRLALQGNVRSLRQRARNLLRDGRDGPLRPSSREYIGELLASIEPVVQPLRAPIPQPIGRNSLFPELESDGLLKIDEHPQAIAPILDGQTHHTLQRLVLERHEADRLRLAGVAPSSTLLLSGPPGVGKTMTAHWIAAAVGLPLLSLQASAVMSSLLGQSARNLASALDHARSAPAVLFLDEFDAYARRRDDSLDVAEPKRLVNSLLMELENWPDSGMIIAATNHFDALDRAIERRFDVHLQLSVPDVATRRRLIDAHLAGMGWQVEQGMITALAAACPGASGSDIVRLCRNAVRSGVLDEIPIELALARVFLPGRLADRSRAAAAGRRAFLSYADDRLALDEAELAGLLGVSAKTVRELRRRSLAG
jgi:ATPase family associated with various cellular activities (AAA)